MSDMMADGHIPPQEILRDENRTCTRKLTRMTGLVLLVAFLGIALTSTRVPAFAVPAQEWVQLMLVLGTAKTLSGLGALWDGTLAAFGWLEVLGPVVMLVLKGIGMAIGAVFYAGLRIYDAMLFISPFSGAMIDIGSEAKPELYRMGALAVWAPFAALMLLGLLVNKLRGKRIDVMAFFLLVFSWLALGTDICGYWLFHTNQALGYGMAGVGMLFVTGALSFGAIFGIWMYWWGYFTKLESIFSKLNLRVSEPDWVQNLRVGIVAAIPLVLMAGAYLGAFYGGTFTGALVCALLAATAYAWCVKSTLTCGYYPKSDFVVIPKVATDGLVGHENVPALEGPKKLGADRPVIDF